MYDEACTCCLRISKAFSFCICILWVIRRAGKNTRVCTRVCIAQWLDSKLSVKILSSSCLITPLSVLICTIYGAHCFPKMANTTRWVGETTLVLKTHLWELSRVVKTELTQLSCNSSQHTCYQSGASCPWIVAGQLAVMSKKTYTKIYKQWWLN